MCVFLRAAEVHAKADFDEDEGAVLPIEGVDVGDGSAGTPRA